MVFCFDGGNLVGFGIIFSFIGVCFLIWGLSSAEVNSNTGDYVSELRRKIDTQIYFYEKLLDKQILNDNGMNEYKSS